MATLTDNINQMAGLVASVKKTYRLTEGTVMRIIDMNIALVQQAQAQAEERPMDFPTDEEIAEKLHIAAEPDIETEATTDTEEK